MNDSEKLIDCTLGCVDCGRAFVFTAGEQLYFQSKKLSIPKRCPPCRLKRKQSLVPEESNYGQ
jgi:hypothetical protein